jgi:hypothetical protein
LTHVDDDAVFASRVIASLPQRTTWFGWLTQSWAPRLAMIAVIVAAAMLWNSRRTTEVAPALAPIASVQFTQPSALMPPLAPRTGTRTRTGTSEPNGTKPLEPLELLEPLEPFVGLSSVESPKALALNDVAPDALTETGTLSVPSLVIADLPLTAETFSQRD